MRKTRLAECSLCGSAGRGVLPAAVCRTGHGELPDAARAGNAAMAGIAAVTSNAGARPARAEAGRAGGAASGSIHGAARRLLSRATRHRHLHIKEARGRAGDVDCRRAWSGQGLQGTAGAKETPSVTARRHAAPELQARMPPGPHCRSHLAAPCRTAPCNLRENGAFCRCGAARRPDPSMPCLRTGHNISRADACKGNLCPAFHTARNNRCRTPPQAEVQDRSLAAVHSGGSFLLGGRGGLARIQAIARRRGPLGGER